MDPFERAEEENAMGYQRWYMEHMFVIAPAGAYVGQWLQSFREFPPRQKPGSFNLDRVMEAVTSTARSSSRSSAVHHRAAPSGTGCGPVRSTRAARGSQETDHDDENSGRSVTTNETF